LVEEDSIKSQHFRLAFIT